METSGVVRAASCYGIKTKKEIKFKKTGTKQRDLVTGEFWGP